MSSVHVHATYSELLWGRFHLHSCIEKSRFCQDSRSRSRLKTRRSSDQDPMWVTDRDPCRSDGNTDMKPSRAGSFLLCPSLALVWWISPEDPGFTTSLLCGGSPWELCCLHAPLVKSTVSHLDHRNRPILSSPRLPDNSVAVVVLFKF